ncbi:MAG: hypothetical protein COA79_25740 [Planctomycetota bacterium]|nr:MAG: hypothetical protein COA79_25740 [Planctomycetota bacterium]
MVKKLLNPLVVSAFVLVLVLGILGHLFYGSCQTSKYHYMCQAYIVDEPVCTAGHYFVYFGMYFGVCTSGSDTVKSFVSNSLAVNKGLKRGLGCVFTI